MKLNWIIPLFAAAGLALAGCGGGGSSSTTSVAPPSGGTTSTVATEPEPTAVTLPSDGNSYLAAADLELADQTISLAAGGSMDVGAYTLSCSDAGACEVTIAGGAVTATGEVTATYTTAAQETIDTAKMAATDEMGERALGVAAALVGDTTMSSDSPKAKIKRGESGAAEISLTGWTGSTASSGAVGWAGMMFDGATPLNKGQSFAVYTNIEAAKRKAFGNAGATASSSVLYSSTAGTGDNAGVTWSGTQLSFATGDNAVGKNQAAHLDMSRFPQPGGAAAKTFTYGDAATDDHKAEFPGTFRGASGLYACTSPPCSVVAPGANAGNPGYTFTGTWTFTPSTGQKGIAADTSHMNFGWWIKTPSKVDSGGDYIYDVEVFSRGVPAATRTDDLGALTNTATYRGPAAGVYVNKTAAMHGTFTASAELLANFDVAGSTTAGVSLNGQITDFSDDAGRDAGMDDWSVKLGAQTAAGALDATGISGTTSGTGKGTWTAHFHGGTATGAVTAPTGVHGTFNAHSTTANIVGAFGADKQ